MLSSSVTTVLRSWQFERLNPCHPFDPPRERPNTRSLNCPQKLPMMMPNPLVGHEPESFSSAAVGGLAVHGRLERIREGQAAVVPRARSRSPLRCRGSQLWSCGRTEGGKCGHACAGRRPPHQQPARAADEFCWTCGRGRGGQAATRRGPTSDHHRLRGLREDAPGSGSSCGAPARLSCRYLAGRARGPFRPEPGPQRCCLRSGCGRAAQAVCHPSARGRIAVEGAAAPPRQLRAPPASLRRAGRCAVARMSTPAAIGDEPSGAGNRRGNPLACSLVVPSRSNAHTSHQAHHGLRGRAALHRTSTGIFANLRVDEPQCPGGDADMLTTRWNPTGDRVSGGPDKRVGS